jgi:hypothetical protein
VSVSRIRARYRLVADITPQHVIDVVDVADDRLIGVPPPAGQLADMSVT